VIVIDANIFIPFLVPDAGSAAVESVFLREQDWIAPPLIRSEFRNILATMIRRRMIDFPTALVSMEEAERLLEGNELPVNSLDVLSLAARSGCTAYDCEYVALAQTLRIPLVTRDKQVLAAFPGIAVSPEQFLKD